MTASELYAQWDELTEQERLDGLTEVINSTLGDAGYTEVTVVAQDLSGEEAWGHFESGNATVVIDSQHIADDSPELVLRTAFHEAAHAMEFQDGDYGSLTLEEQQSYNDFVSLEGSYVNGELELEDIHAPEHEDIKDYAANAVERALTEDPNAMSMAPEAPPGSPTAPSSSPSRSSDGGESGSSSNTDFGFEIDYANAVVTDGNGFSFEMQLDQATVTP